jgi:hypothetical protein
MSAENASGNHAARTAAATAAGANAPMLKDDSNELSVPATPVASNGSNNNKRLASQTSPLEAERRRLAEEFDGSYWNSSSSQSALSRLSAFYFFFLGAFF